tara:strand:- start:131 stop:286 length:156 start_codon:yes stop_codon:yes gene_type:complete
VLAREFIVVLTVCHIISLTQVGTLSYKCSKLSREFPHAISNKEVKYAHASG